jgi:hypothetical protein
VTLNENKKILKDRLALLKNGKKPHRVLELALCVVLIAAAAVTGAYAGTAMPPVVIDSEGRFIQLTYMPAPVVEYRVDPDDGWTYLFWDVITGARNHIVFVNGEFTGQSMGTGGDGWAGFAVEFLMDINEFSRHFVPGNNYIQIQTVSEWTYSELSEPVVYYYTP